MSIPIEHITPQQFTDADGVDDWRVLYWGAHAFFRAGSYAQGAALVGDIAALVADDEHDPDVDLRREGVAVKLISRGIRNLSTRDIELARAVSAAAAKRGLTADPSRIQVVQVAIASVPDAPVLPFWQAALGYVRPNDSHLVDPLRRNSSFFLQDEMPADRPRRGRMHIDVAVPHDQVHARIDAIVAAGGRIADDSAAPEWWTLADAENHGVDITTWWGRDSVRLEEEREEREETEETGEPQETEDREKLPEN
ncbi:MULTISPECIES: VOC family protein [unclassified Leifsonia]|uniref:VOC family protein n=1 Tax=unclassified Leifsonia TaxID=2663824 RepID=UPI0009E70E6E|nr:MULTISPECIES: VOC family protein [unclassified Leifsonia]